MQNNSIAYSGYGIARSDKLMVMIVHEGLPFTVELTNLCCIIERTSIHLTGTMGQKRTIQEIIFALQERRQRRRSDELFIVGFRVE